MYSEIKIWSDKLGILPVNFLHNQSAGDRAFALLDGVRNNFGLSFNYESNPEQLLSEIWSAGMSNYAIVKDDKLRLYNVKRGFEPETIPYTTVLWDIFNFRKYLSSISLPEEETIVPYIMDFFRIIRNDLREKNSASDSLKIFLYIISQLGGHDIKWKLPDGIDNAINSLNSKSLLYDVIDRMKMKTIGGVKPNVGMILRHCAGHLFQEANYVAQFSPQLELFASSSFRVMRSQRQIGSYYTPIYIARSIVEKSLEQIKAYEKDKIVIFDPACGSGVFLVEALRQLRSNNFKGKVEIIGWDIDPLAKAMADFVLQYESIEWNDKKITFNIEQKDSLAHYAEWPKADVIFMNPPYVSWTLMTPEQRDLVIAITGKLSSNRPNLASLFYLLACGSLLDNGCVGSLMPSSFLTTDSARSIRNKANENARPTLICNLGGFIFDSVMADVSILIATNKKETYDVQMVWTKNREDVASAALQELRRINDKATFKSEDKDFHIYVSPYRELLATDNWKCLSKESFQLRQKMFSLITTSDVYDTASNLFNIKQGARTGANSTFIITSSYYESLPKAERIFFRPSVDNASIVAGKLYKSNYLFYPYSKDSLLLTDETSLKRAVPTYYKTHLEKEKEKLSNRSKIDSTKWWSLTWPRNWQFAQIPKMVSTEFGKSGSFAYDSSGEYVVERGLVWLPKMHSFDESDYYRYIALMNTPFFNRLLDLFSNELIGGVYNLETKYMKNIPLPIFSKINNKISNALLDFGKQMSSGLHFNIDLLDTMVRNLYGEK